MQDIQSCTYKKCKSTAPEEKVACVMALTFKNFCAKAYKYPNSVVVPHSNKRIKLA
jgi:hypothetical protein